MRTYGDYLLEKIIETKYRNVESNAWKMAIVGFIVAALYLPLNVIMSTKDGLLVGGNLIINKYFYQLTILLCGFGSSFAYFFDKKFSRFINFSLIYLALVPLLLFLIVTLLFDYWYSKNLISIEAVLFLMQFLLIGWYFLYGGVSSIYLQKLENVTQGWLFHLIGIVFGYVFSYLYLNYLGVVGLVLFSIVCVAWLVDFNKIYKFILTLIVCVIPFFEGDVNSWILSRKSKIEKEDQFVIDDLIKKASFDKSYFGNKSKLIYYNFGVRGLTEVIQSDDYRLALYVNKFHSFSYDTFAQINNDRAFIYNELFTDNNRKAIIGIGGARSLENVNPEKLNNLDAVEINKDTIAFALKYKNDLHSKLSKINYLNLDGRFYIDTLKNEYLDVVIYEGATMQAQSVQSIYLKPNFLSNSDSIKSVARKLNPDGIFVFERNQMASEIKQFQFYSVISTLMDLGFYVRIIGNLKLKNFYIFASLNEDSLNKVDNILINSDKLREIQLERLNQSIFGRFDNCSSHYNDNYPYLGVFCGISNLLWSVWPISLALVIFSLSLILSSIYIYKKMPHLKVVSYTFMFQGVLQSVLFSLIQFKFDSYLWNDNFTLIMIIILGVISAFLGNLFFSKTKVSLKLSLVLILSCLVAVLLLPYLNTSLIESIFIRMSLLGLVCFIFNFSVGGIFSNLLLLVEKHYIGQMLFWDSLGLFLGYLSNYFILRVFGLNWYSVFIILVFVVFLFFLSKNRNRLITN